MYFYLILFVMICGLVELEQLLHPVCTITKTELQNTK